MSCNALPKSFLATVLGTVLALSLGSAATAQSTPYQPHNARHNYAPAPLPGDPPPVPTKWIGQKRVAIILLSFQGAPYPHTGYPDYAALRQGIHAKVFTNPNSTNEFWKYTSYGTFSITGEVFGPVDMPFGPYPCDRDKWALTAQELLTQDPGETYPTGFQFDIGNYDLIAYSNDKDVAGCKSQGKPGYTPPSAFMDNFSLRATAHELGHALGLSHSNGYQCFDPQGTPAPMGVTCNSLEYGDYYDVMGLVGDMTYNQQRRGQLGWIQPGTTATVVQQEPPQPQTFNLYPIESSDPSRLKVLRIPRVNGPFGYEQFYYVELRQPVDFDMQQFTMSSPMANGTMIRLGRGYNRYGNTYLLDANPQSIPPNEELTVFHYVDAPFVPSGGSPAAFVDPTTNTTISTEFISKDPHNFNNTFARVTVLPGDVLDCDYGDPSVSFSPAGQYVVVDASKVLSFSLDLTNGDSADCPPIHLLFDFAGAPEGWGLEALTLLSGEALLEGQQSMTVTRNINIPGAEPGVTELTLNVVNNYTGRTAPPITVTVEVQ